MRIHANATVSADDPLLEEFPGAQVLVRASITESFINCGRYIVKHDRVAPSPYVPDAGGDAPLPAWKQVSDIRPFLPPDDQQRAKTACPGLTIEEYNDLVGRGEA